MRYRTAIAALLAVTVTGGFCHAADPRYPDWPCVQAKVPEISVAAVWTGPSLDDVQDKWKDDARISAMVAKLAARQSPLRKPEKTSRISWPARLTRLRPESSCSQACSTSSMPSVHRSDGPRAGDPQTARGSGEDSRRYDRPAGATGRITTRSIQNRRTEQSAALENADIRGPATRGEVRMRSAYENRPATIRARPRDPAGIGVALVTTCLLEASCLARRRRPLVRSRLRLRLRERQISALPTVGSVRIPSDIGISKRHRPLCGVPRHPAIGLAKDHEQRGLVARMRERGRAADSFRSPAPISRNRCRATTGCREC